MAVKALVYLEKHGELCASGSIARSIDCEVTLVRRVLTRLVQADLIAAREGREGGYVLTRSADHITLADIYHAIEICDPIFPGMMHEPETNPFCEELAIAVSEILAESERRMLEVWGPIRWLRLPSVHHSWWGNAIIMKIQNDNSRYDSQERVVSAISMKW